MAAGKTASHIVPATSLEVSKVTNMPHRHDAPVSLPRPIVSRLFEINPGEKVPDDRTTTHLLTILSVSSAMVGVCLTAIGLLGIMKSLTKLETLCDDVLAFDSLIYLIATGLSFVGLRSPLRKHATQVAIAVDVTFCLALALTVVATIILVWVF